jgi:protein-L-isoaspartate(D-aspartate) O-methyltransferase
LEIGTGSGYQSAILSYLTTDIYTIEIIRPLFIETDALYRDLEEAFPSYSAINRKLGDGYYGWEEYAPFDKIIVTCSIDHIPPPLLRQLKPGGIMVLPLGPPNRQYIMEIMKHEDEEGAISLSRRDVYNGMSVKFIPFRDNVGSSYSSPLPPE